MAAGFAGVLFGAFATSVLVWNYGNFIGGPAAGGRSAAAPAATERFTGGVESDDVVAVLDAQPGSSRPERAAAPAGTPAAPIPIDSSVPTLSAGASVAIDELKTRRLAIPVQGIEAAQLQHTFTDPRSNGRVHMAIDILAARNTPVLAVEDGTVARLFNSRAGGITLYQYDPSSRFVYYYAHLERYADGLKENGPIRRGQVLGYVGTSGNAPPNTPHLHFAIFEMSDGKRWWEGTPVDPFLVLR